MDFRLDSNEACAPGYSLLRLSPVEGKLPECRPGQFVEIKIDHTRALLRRPISICDADYERNQLILLVKDAGQATHELCLAAESSVFSILLPLGHGFSFPESKEKPVLLAGGGVGIAPLLYWGKELKRQGYIPVFLVGARRERDLLLGNELERIGSLNVATEDGSRGVKGLITAHPALAADYGAIYTCGPQPMMKAVAQAARISGTPCEASLENKMACGLGACLCCVEPTKEGNRCVCTEGPVFNIDELKW